MWVDLNGKVKVLQSLLCVMEDAVGNGSVEEYSIILVGRQSSAVASDSLVVCKKKKVDRIFITKGAIIFKHGIFG